MNIDQDDIVNISLIEEKLRGRAYRNLWAHGAFDNLASVQSHILLATILYQIKEIRKLDKLLYIEVGNFLIRDFFLNKISHDYINVGFPYQIEPEQKADLVFGQFPFGMRLPKEARTSKHIPRVDSSTQMVVDSVDVISKDGLGIFLTLPYSTTFLRDNLRKHLDSKGVFVNGIIKLPKDFLKPLTSLEAELVLVSRVKTDKEFILAIDSLTNFDFNLGNLFNKVESDDLSVGTWVSPETFQGFEILDLEKEINSIGGGYLDFSTLSLEQICKEVNLVRTGDEFEEKKDAVYIPLIGNQEAVLTVDELSIKHQNYAQLVVDTKEVLPGYLCSFMNSKVGKKSLGIEKAKIPGVIPRLSKARLISLNIRVPPDIDNQRKVAELRDKLKLIQEKVNELVENIAINPLDNSSHETTDLIIESLGQLSASDQILALVRQGEGKTTEFKETYCLDIRTGKKESYITAAIIKTVAAFLNSDGGNLLIGVSDSKRITGMRAEIEKFFKQGGPNPEDNLLKNLKDRLQSSFGEEFYPLIDTNLFTIESDYVLRIECKPSDTEVFLNSNREFYVRTNPATDRLEGKNLTEYVKRRFL